ncbi:MAG TPA: lysophospholipid acyltransferase family protein [Dehalococcoidia bacterium]|nr:lysophospholipid acyltransferase family protein [Dehalococcoidia bacterium]
MWRFVLFSVAVHTLGRLPVRALYALASLIGEASYLLFPRQRRRVWENLRHAVPPDTPKARLRALARRVFRNVALYYADLISMPHLDPQKFFDERLIVHGLEENLFPAVRAGGGVIVISGHCGNPELAVHGLIPKGIRILALTEPLAPPRLSKLVDRIRSASGHRAMPVGVAGVRQVVQTLRKGGVVALMGDRDIRGPKARLPFLGSETLMPTGPIEVALRTGATVIPAFTSRLDRCRIEAWLEEPLELERTGDLEHDVRNGTLRFLERLERHLRADPGQWAVLEAIWDTPSAIAKEPAAAGRAG